MITALVQHGAKLDTRDVGSRDTIYKLAGHDVAGQRRLNPPSAGHTLDWIYVTDPCR